TVREVRAEAGVLDRLSRGAVHELGDRAGAERGVARALRGVHRGIDLPNLVGRVPERDRARDVGRVAMHLAAAVDEEDRALREDRVARAAVRKRGGRPDLNEPAAPHELEAELL